MAERKTDIRFFNQLEAAEEYMRRRNRDFRRAANCDPFVVIDGPEDNYAVVDLSTAIDMDVPYSWPV